MNKRSLTAHHATVVVLLATATLCMTASIFLPLYSKYFNGFHDEVQRSAHFFSNLEEKAFLRRKATEIRRTFVRDMPCTRMSVFYSWAWLLAVAAAGCGGLATLLGAAWVSVGRSVALSVEVFLLSVLAFACSGAALGLMSYAYCGQLCSEVSSPRESDFYLAEGFILLCVAVGGFLLLTVMQAIGFCYGCQMGPRVARRTMNEVARVPVVKGQDAAHMCACTAAKPRRVGTTGSDEAYYGARIVVGEICETHVYDEADV